MSKKSSPFLIVRMWISICWLLVMTVQPSFNIAQASSTSANPLGLLVESDLTRNHRPGAVNVYFNAIAAGGTHTCAVTPGGGAKCWGQNDYGQLGDGTTINRSTPVDVVGLSSGVTAIAVGQEYACALLSSGGVKCWGGNWVGQLGNGTWTDSLTPVDVSGLQTGVAAITAGRGHTCVVVSGGGMKCWGYNWYGQLGDGSSGNHNIPVDVYALPNGVTAIAAGGNHTCAMVPSGGMKCWGDNRYGQLGDGTTDFRLVPVDVIGLPEAVTAITTGGIHTCAVLASGGVMCWGNNEHGQLGDATTEHHNTPVEVSGLAEGVADLSAGDEHSCALLVSGGVKCWGDNWSGQIGDNTTTDRTTPVGVIGLSEGVTDLATGLWHTCALLASGGLKCWGENFNGQLGDGTKSYHTLPVDNIMLASGISLISAGGAHTCAITPVGGVKCWGLNVSGQLGDGTTTLRSTPVDVVGLTSGVIDLSAGNGHNCIRNTAGGVKCWGYNLYGELGDGSLVNRSTPVDVIGLGGDVIAISAGGYHTCVILSGGGMQCWGLNQYGELGDGTNQNHTTPVDVSGLDSGVTAIATGLTHTCALLSSGGVKCWGYNYYGQLGNGNNLDSYLPVDVTGLTSGVTGLDAQGEHTCASLVGGGLKCWGDNFHGQLGDGTNLDSNLPVDVSGLTSGVTNVSAGYDHTCALLTNGGVKCWGDNQYGQLGNGTIEASNMPVDVSGMAFGATLLSAGDLHTCVLVGIERPKCWGGDDYGQLGRAKVTEWYAPVDVIDLLPSLNLNYPSGQPGSIFTLTGWDFPPSSTLTLTVNSQVVTTTLAINPTGSFIVFLDTTGLQPGGYVVTVGSNPSASIGFYLTEDGALRPQEGGGVILPIFSSSVEFYFMYVPLSMK